MPVLRLMVAALSALLLLGLGCLVGCSTMGAGRSIEPQAIAPGVYWVAGSGGAADQGNEGRIGNAGFIVGDDGVIVVDAGSSYAHGRDLLAAIRKVSDKPIRMVLLTHIRPEFLFGGQAFREQGIAVRAHRKAAQLMAARCHSCLKRLRQELGEEIMRGTALYRPDQTFDATHDIDLAGRKVRVLYFGHSSGPGDVAIWDQRTGVLFAGGLLDAERIPDIEDANISGWRQALTAMRNSHYSKIIPGHGRPGSAQDLISPQLDYLRQLEDRARLLVESGTSLVDVAENSEMAQYRSWDQYEIIHPRNAAIAFRRFERELLFK